MLWGGGICGTAPPLKSAKRASAQRRSLSCSAGTPFHILGQHHPAGPPLFRRCMAFTNAAEKRAAGSSGLPLPPADGMAYHFGRFDLGPAFTPTLLWENTVPLAGPTPTRRVPLSQAAQSLFHHHRKGVAGSPKRFSLAPADKRASCFGRSGLGPFSSLTVLCEEIPPVLGQCRPSRPPLFKRYRVFAAATEKSGQQPQMGLSPRQVGRPTTSAGSALLPSRPVEGGSSPSPSVGTPAAHPVERLAVTPLPAEGDRFVKGGYLSPRALLSFSVYRLLPSNLPDRQQGVQSFSLLLTGRAIDRSSPSRKELIASWKSVGFSLRHGALALPSRGISSAAATPGFCTQQPIAAVTTQNRVICLAARASPTVSIWQAPAGSSFSKGEGSPHPARISSSLARVIPT